MRNSKYNAILTDIRARIADGRLQPNELLPTENEMIKSYQVSRTTVLRALNILVCEGLIYRVAGRGTFVSEGSICHDACEKAKLPGGKYAIIIHNQSPTIIQYLEGAQEFFLQYGATLNVHFSKFNYESEISLLSQLLKEDYDGILIYPFSSMDPKHYYEQLAYCGKPVILLDKQVTGANLSSVSADNQMIGRIAATHLLQKGYRTFAFASQHFSFARTIGLRYKGFCAVLRQHGIPLSKVDIILTPDSFSGMENAIDQFLSRKDEPGIGLFCVYDEIAACAYKSAEKKGLCVGNDIGIIGCDNLSLAHVLSPGLTTIEQPYFQIGKEAAQLAMRLSADASCSVINIQLPVKLVERDSCCSKR